MESDDHHTPAEFSSAGVQQQEPDREASHVFSDDGEGQYEVLGLEAGWGEPFSDEESLITADDLIQQLATADLNSAAVLLQQITQSHYSIAGCRTWHQLLLSLRDLLHHTATPGINSSITDVRSHPASVGAPTTAQDSDQASSLAAAVEQFILQKLAPEVLDCSPEPLAEVLIALLTASRWQPAAAHATAPCDDHPQPQHSHIDSYGCEAPPYSNLSSSAVQLLVVGLHKIARQWHFLDQGLSQQLSHAIVGVLLIPLQLVSADRGMHRTMMQPMEQECQEQQGRLHRDNVGRAARVAIQEQQRPQQHVCCCLAEQLVLADASMGWLHRLSACSSSGRPLRRAMESRGLAGHLIRWLLASTASSDSAASATHRKSESPQRQCSSSCSDRAVQLGQQQLQHCRCIIDQLLSTLLETPAGRRLLMDSQQDAARLQCVDASNGPSNPEYDDATQQCMQSADNLLSAAMSRTRMVSGNQYQEELDCDAAVMSATAEAARLAIRAVQQQDAE